MYLSRKKLLTHFFVTNFEVMHFLWLHFNLCIFLSSGKFCTQKSAFRKVFNFSASGFSTGHLSPIVSLKGFNTCHVSPIALYHHRVSDTEFKVQAFSQAQVKNHTYYVLFTVLYCCNELYSNDLQKKCVQSNIFRVKCRTFFTTMENIACNAVWGKVVRVKPGVGKRKLQKRYSKPIFLLC